jgi:hypothetical protein
MLNFAPLTVLLLSDDNRVNQGLWNQANWIEIVLGTLMFFRKRLPSRH